MSAPDDNGRMLFAQANGPKSRTIHIEDRHALRLTSESVNIYLNSWLRLCKPTVRALMLVGVPAFTGLALAAPPVHSSHGHVELMLNTRSIMKVNVSKSLPFFAVYNNRLSTEQGLLRVICVLEIQMPIIGCCGLANQPRIIERLNNFFR